MKSSNYNRANFVVVTYRMMMLMFAIVVFISSILFLVSYSAFKEQFSSSIVYQTLSKHKAESLFYLMSQENHHFSISFDKSFSPPSLSSTLLELTTSIRAQDARSLFGSELPGFSIYDSNLIIAGEGTNFTNFPRESAPPLDVILKERELAKENIEQSTETETRKQSANTTNGKKVFYIYHTHSWESYLPLLGLEGDPDADKAVDNKTNINIVGKMLGKELEAQGIGTDVNLTNMGEELNKKGWKTPKSYAVSRTMVETAMAQNKDLTYFIDLHRDALRKDKTTIKIGDKSYAKIMFVLGKSNQNFEQNLKMAKSLHEGLEKKYPGLSRGVLGKNRSSGNGVYNQDLSGNAVLVEIGGVDNNMEELTNTVKALSDVISEFYWDAEKVSGQS
ncbi:stage II sporulation protein P [Priestia megaterium]|nr:stage II sporulation protein P [Priestia megaterium]